MPESAEIEITVNELNKYLKGAEILKITGDGRYKGKTFNLKYPVKINDIGKRGKFIYWVLDTGEYIFNTLGLSGHWSLTHEPNTSIELHYKKGNKLGKLYLIDQLHYATFGIHDNLESKLKTIGPDIADTDFNTFKSEIDKHPNENIGTLLLDQGVISGIGNYIRAEALYKSKISPFRKVKDISTQMLESLYKTIKSIVKAAYKAGGASVTFYKSITGKQGTYESKFKVYGHDTDDLGNPVKHEKLGERTIYWVPAIQK